ncbi:aminotransferase class V-fold PLP-dependent enzyme [Candidatus Thorarchaeota archaeon]|nr:MAG: aminotransferase class V-fold PLP-dependent enzyme [Candidatus Thorarchaeota archaeon]
MTSSFVEKLRKTEFPTLNTMVYLNNASTGIMPQRTVKAVGEYLQSRVAAKGDFEKTLATFDIIRSNLAKLLGGTREEYGFVPNTSTGLNTFANGLDYPKDSNIVICDLEFPANYIPWQYIAKRNNIELKVVRSQQGAVSDDDFLNAIDENTSVVAISLVQFSSGYVPNIEMLADAVHEMGGFIAVDIIQAAGWKDIDLQEMGVDFATAQAAKWLIGPIGAGFLFLRKELLDIVTPAYLGWWGVKNMEDFGYAMRKPLDDARRFEVGSPAMMAYVGFLKSLDLLLDIPSRKREEAALEVSDYLRTCLDESDIEYYRFEERNRSPIVSCKPSHVEMLHNSLLKENIHCSVRNGRLRVSPHFYNTKDDIDLLMEQMR